MIRLVLKCAKKPIFPQAFPTPATEHLRSFWIEDHDSFDWRSAPQRASAYRYSESFNNVEQARVSEIRMYSYPVKLCGPLR